MSADLALEAKLRRIVEDDDLEYVADVSVGELRYLLDQIDELRGEQDENIQETRDSFDPLQPTHGQARSVLPGDVLTFLREIGQWQGSITGTAQELLRKYRSEPDARRADYEGGQEYGRQ